MLTTLIAVFFFASALSQAPAAQTAPDACALITQAEAAVIMGVPSRAPRQGAFAANTCAIQSESSPGTLYLNITLDTDATLQAQGMPATRQAFDGMKSTIADAEPLAGIGDAAFFSKKNNGLYIVKSGKLASALVAPELTQREASIAALKQLGAAIAARM